MDSIIRALVIYLFLLIFFRIAGKRTLAEITTFDFVLLLIISEATQGALTDGDESMTNAMLTILTLVGANILFSHIKHRSQRADKILEGQPVVIVSDGKPLQEPMDKERIDEEDILHAAREVHGLERIDQIKYAILETSGGISIVPKEGDR